MPPGLDVALRKVPGMVYLPVWARNRYSPAALWNGWLLLDWQRCFRDRNRVRV